MSKYHEYMNHECHEIFLRLSHFMFDWNIYIYIYIFTINNTNNNIINITKKWHFQGLQGILFKKFK